MSCILIFYLHISVLVGFDFTDWTLKECRLYSLCYHIEEVQQSNNFFNFTLVNFVSCGSCWHYFLLTVVPDSLVTYEISFTPLSRYLNAAKVYTWLLTQYHKGFYSLALTDFVSLSFWRKNSKIVDLTYPQGLYQKSGNAFTSCRNLWFFHRPLRTRAPSILEDPTTRAGHLGQTVF